MSNFSLLIQVFFFWSLLILEIVLLVQIFNLKKSKGWIVLALGAIVELLNKIITIGSSFWIREQVHMEDLPRFSSSVTLASTFLGVIAYGLTVAGLFMLYNSYKENKTGNFQQQTQNQVTSQQTSTPQARMQQPNNNQQQAQPAVQQPVRQTQQSQPNT